jgi:hypothetical protein
MRRIIKARNGGITLLSVSALSLLATVSGCGRNSEGTQQQLLNLASKSSARLKANSEGAADTLTKRNASATERLLRGLIDKEREERMAEDKRLSDRIDALELELRGFKEQVEKRFSDVDSRDKVLRLYMEGEFSKLKDADIALSGSISEVDRKFAQKLGETELKLKAALQKQNDDLTAYVSSEAGKIRGELAAQDNALRAEIAVQNANTLAQLDSVKKELEAKILKNTKDLEANKVLFDQKTATLQAAMDNNVAELKKALELQKSELMGEVAKTNAKLTATDSRLTKINTTLTNAINKTKTQLLNEIKTTKNTLQASIDANKTALEESIAKQAVENQKLQAAIAANAEADIAAAKLARDELTAEIAKSRESIYATVEDLKATESMLKKSISQTKEELVASLEAQKTAFEASKAELTSELNATKSNLDKTKTDLQNAIDNKIADVKTSLESQKNDLNAKITANTNAIAANKSEFETKVSELNKKIDDNDQKIVSTAAALSDFKLQVAKEKAALEKAIVDSKNSLAEEMKALIKKTDDENRLAWQKSLDAVAAEAKADSSKNAEAIDALRAKSIEIVDQIAATNSNLSMTNAEISRVKKQMLAKIEEASNKSAADLKSVADGLLIKMADADAKVRSDLETKINNAASQSAADLKAATQDITMKMKTESVNVQLKMAALTEQIVKVDTEGKARADAIEKKMSEDIDNVRGEFNAKVSVLNATVSETRDVLSKKINEGLSNLGSVMESKLVALEGKMSVALKAEVSKLTGDISKLENQLSETDQKLTTQLAAEISSLRSASDKKLSDLSKSLNEKIDSSNTNLKAQIDNLVETQKLKEIESAKQIATIMEKMAKQDLDIAAYDAKLAAASAEQKVALELEKQARAAELLQLQSDLSALNSAQNTARAKLEEDLKSALTGQAAASAAEITNLKGALKALDDSTFATVGQLKNSLAEERKTTEAQILASAMAIEKKLADAALETQKVAARVEAVAQAQDEFKAYVAKNYATKGELLALQARVEGLEDVTKIMNADMVKSNAEMKALISKEVDAAKTALTERIQSVEANVTDIRDKLGGAIDDYQKQITAIKDNMSKELSAVRTDMKTQDAALFASIAENKAKQDAVNADLMLNVKTQAANFETMSQNIKKELSDKLTALEGQVDQTKADLVAEKDAVQKKFAEVVAAEQALKDQMTKELTALKDQIKNVEAIANQSLAMAKQNADDIKLIKADIEEQKKMVAEKFKLTDSQLTKLNDDLKLVKEDFNKRLGEVAANAEKLVKNLGDEVTANFKKVATDIAQMNAQDKAMESALSGHLLEVVDLKLDEATMTAFSDGVSSDVSKVTKVMVNGKATKGPLITTLELFAEVRKAFLQALQPKMPTRSDTSITRNEAFDQEFVPIMVACGGRADADFANAYGRDSFDFLADEFISSLVTANRGTNMDALFFKQPKLSDGSSLHHYIMVESIRKLEGAADNPQCVSQIKTWAANVLNGTSTMSKDVRARLSANENLKRMVTDFSKAVSDLKAPVDAVELRFAKQINSKHTTISSAMANITSANEKLGKVAPADASNTLLGKLAFTMTDGVDSTFEAIQRQEEFDNIVAVQKRFAQNEAEDKKQNDRLNALDKDVAAMKKQLESFSKTANDVKALQEKTNKMEGALSKALDVMLSLAIRSGHSDLVAATRQAGSLMGYAPQEIIPIRPHITEIQHFFAAPALASGSDTCTGNSIRRGAGVKFWSAQGTMQCWVNFRGISSRQWQSAASTVWFRVFGAAASMNVRSNLCDKGANSACNSNFNFEFNRATATSVSAAGVSAKLTGQPNEGVFDFMMPGALEPYIRRSGSFGYGYMDSAWWGEVMYFTPYGSSSNSGGTWGHRLQLYSPLVLDFTNVGRPQFTSIDQSGVRFDLNGDGVKERTGWIGGYGGVGLLALDLNGNGGIDNGLELFGEGTRIVSNGRKARDGYAALAQYDANKDGVIDAKDPMYRKLVVWFDKNKDGVSDKSELVSLADSGVTKIGLKFTRLTDNERFVNGNEIRYAAKFWGPSDCGKAGCSSYDVYFSTGFTTAKKSRK